MLLPTSVFVCLPRLALGCAQNLKPVVEAFIARRHPPETKLESAILEATVSAAGATNQATVEFI